MKKYAAIAKNIEFTFKGEKTVENALICVECNTISDALDRASRAYGGKLNNFLICEDYGLTCEAAKFLEPTDDGVQEYVRVGNDLTRIWSF